MTLVGIFASMKAKKSSEDYLLAGRSVSPFATALSAVSSCHSGFMFIGYIGFTYWYGISSLWFALTWVLGDLIIWLKIYKPLREKTEELKVNTISSFIGSQSKNFSKKPEQEKQANLVTKVSALISFIFLGTYAAAQLKAGGKALGAILDWDYSWGIIIGAIIVFIYCLSGGIRASIWTDVVQSIIMMISMLLLMGIAVHKCGGFTELFSTIESIDPSLLDIKPRFLELPMVLFLIGLMANGLAVVGQPHVVVRAMAINSKENLGLARNIYISWYSIFSLAAVGVGLSSRVLLPDLGSTDSELTLPMLSMDLLPQVLSGLVLAGIFSAAISTADSQVISCSANLSQDLFSKQKDNYLFSKISTLITTALVLTIALFFHESVFNLTVFAWSALGTSLGSLVILKCLDRSPDEKTSILMLISSVIGVILWKYFFPYSQSLHEALIGFLIAFGIYFSTSSTRKRSGQLG